MVAVKRRPAPRLRSAASRLLLVLFGILAALALLELLLSVYNPFHARIKGNRIVLQTNTTYHIKNDVITRLAPEVTVVRNAIGFRGPNPPTNFENHLTIVTIGGSTTQDFFLSEDETWTARLGQRLEKSLQPLWINNAGLDGHSTHGHLILLEDYVAPLRPKVALFLVGSNDLAVSTVSEWDVENIKSGINVESSRAFVKSLSAYSEVVALLLNTYRSFTAYQTGITHREIDLREQGYLDISQEAERVYVDRNSGPYLKDYEVRLKRLVDLCREAGIEPVFITQPMLAGFGIDEVTGVDLARVRAQAPQQTGKMYWDLLEAYNDSTRRVGHDSGIVVVDLARELPKTSRYFYDFLHYTPQGAEAIADILYRSLCPMLATRFPEYHISGCAH